MKRKSDKQLSYAAKDKTHKQQMAKFRQAEISMEQVDNTLVTIKTLTDFELEFVRRKHEGWIKMYERINPVLLSRTIEREKQFLAVINREIKKRKS